MTDFDAREELKRREIIEVEPYLALAQWYDEVMDHVDYKRWAAHVLRLARRHGRKPRSAVDFACGTGSLAYFLARAGVSKVAGADAGEQMVEEAKRIIEPDGAELEFHVSDLRETPPVSPRDLGVCLYDSLNYLMELEAVEQFARAARPVIRSGGLLIVDVSTIRNSREHFSGYEIDEAVEEGWYLRESHFDRADNVQHNIFHFLPAHGDVAFREHHRQRIWPVEEVVGCLQAGGFQLLGTYHEMTTREGGEYSDRVHIVLEPE